MEFLIFLLILMMFGDDEMWDTFKRIGQIIILGFTELFVFVYVYYKYPSAQILIDKYLFHFIIAMLILPSIIVGIISILQENTSDY